MQKTATLVATSASFADGTCGHRTADRHLQRHRFVAGAGKSTFLKILSGQLEPTNGDVVITPGQRLSFLQQDHFKYDAYLKL